jgi:protein-S-isoprenylcysteine O-methyltransferase Ste14
MERHEASLTAGTTLAAELHPATPDFYCYFRVACGIRVVALQEYWPVCGAEAIASARGARVPCISISVRLRQPQTGKPRSGARLFMEEDESYDDRAAAIALPPLILTAIFGIGLLFHHAWPLRMSGFIEHPYSVALGSALVILALAIALSAVREMRAAKTPLDVRKPATEIVTTGPFYFSRNPIYLGMVLFMAGIGFVMDSLWILGFVIVLAVVLQKGVIEPEETYLERKFGVKYLEYKSRVRRWI